LVAIYAAQKKSLWRNCSRSNIFSFSHIRFPLQNIPLLPTLCVCFFNYLLHLYSYISSILINNPPLSRRRRVVSIYQHLTSNLFRKKVFGQLFSTYSLYFLEKILAKRLLEKCWWNWQRETTTTCFSYHSSCWWAPASQCEARAVPCGLS